MKRRPKKNTPAYWKNEASLQREVADIWRAMALKMYDAIQRHGYQLVPRAANDRATRAESKCQTPPDR